MVRAVQSGRRAARSPALAAYHRKRNLAVSGEPRGGKRAAAAVPSYVIQKHDATRLHYDFRLEVDGVLKSWAVPKGLPARVGDKALAIEVEDHPLDYGGFEGTIPDGNYGAGTVMLWDRGVYALEGGDFTRAHKRGRLHVALAGEKLRGEWTLVRMRPKPGEKKDNWLVIRNHASGRIPKVATSTVERDLSVLTGRTMDEIAAGDTARRGQRRTPPKKKAPETAPNRSGRARRPAFIAPMKALGVTEIPRGDWRCEIKFDGYRALAALERDRLPQLWSRNQKSFGADYPEIVAALGKLKCRDALIDGEIVALDAAGRSHFQLLQQREAAEARPPLYYYAFDLLQLDGASLLERPIEERQAALAKLWKNAPDILRVSTVFTVPPADLMKEAARLRLEGIVAKAAGSLYEPGRRSGAWLKCRISSEQEFVIGGYTPPEGSRTHFGALLVGYHADGKLLYAGKVGTGFDQRRLAELHALFSRRERRTCPFANLPATGRPRFGQPMNAAAMRRVRWLKPDLVAQVRFSEWTEGGHLRQPVFLGLRQDKPAAEVVREAGPA
jgi:bifunctional non-homologous end joining protein LigD